jgi:cold shock CspA family protein
VLETWPSSELNYSVIGDTLNTTATVDYERVPDWRMEVNDTKLVGRIIKISRQGWGFISSREIEFTRIFFHWTALRQDTTPFLQLRNGMMVEFTPIQIPDKGWRAMHVRVLEREEKNNEGSQVSPLSE